MSMLALSSITIYTDIARHIRLLVDTLNSQYPLRRVELELSPSSFCQELIEESPSFNRRLKAPNTMPRSLFDSLFEAANQCVNRDTRSSMAMFAGLYLREFYLDPSYPSSLFIDNKVVVPHDAVFLTLYHLRVYASLQQSDLKHLVSDICAFIPPKTIKRFVSVVDPTASAAPPAAPQPLTFVPIRMSTFGINVTDTLSSLGRTASRKLLSAKPQDVRVTPDSARVQRQDSLAQPMDATAEGQGSSRPPATRLASKKPMYNSSPLRNVSDPSPPSPSSASLKKRLFESEISSARHRKKTRNMKDSANKEQRSPQQQIVESSKKANKQRAHRSVRKNKKRNTLPDQLAEDSSPQTSPITKKIPGSFLLRGERLEGHLA